MKKRISVNVQDIVITLDYMKQVVHEHDHRALDDLYDKLQGQIDSFYEERSIEIRAP